MKPRPILWVDTETGGLDVVKDAIVQVAALVTDTSGKIARELSLEIKPWPSLFVSSGALAVQKRTYEILTEFPHEEPDVLDIFDKFTETSSVQFAGYNCSFDLGFMHHLYTRHGRMPPYVFEDKDEPLDVLKMAWRLIPKTKIKNHKLATVAEYFGLDTEGAHEALWDIKTTLQIWLKLKELDG